ncbi:MAG: DUF2892 domain-containing protein [Sandaracinus sp.]|jgi:hypothetical protein
MLAKLLPKNEHSIDRGLRVVLGVALLALTFVGPHTLWGLVGIVPLATGLLGSCPLYTLFGFSTCPVETKAQKA